MTIKKISNKYLNNDSTWTPIKTIGLKVNEIIDSLNSLITTVENLQQEVSSGEFENITVTNTATIANLNLDGSAQINDATIGELSVSNNLNIEKTITLAKGNITQSGSIFNTVTLPFPNNYSSGIITTVFATIAAGDSASFNVVSNLLSSTTNTVILSVIYGGAGIPVITHSPTFPGAIAIRITNVSTTDALDNILKIHYIAV
jgi:hypothetical protein